MKIALVLYPACDPADLTGLVEPLTRLDERYPAQIEYCAPRGTNPAAEPIQPTRVGEPLVGYDALVVPGGPGVGRMAADPDFLGWLGTAKEVPLRAAVGGGAALLASAGLLVRQMGQRSYREPLDAADGYPQHERFVLAPGTLLAQDSTTALDLGVQLCEQLFGRQAMEEALSRLDEPVSGAGEDVANAVVTRKAEIERKTHETRVRVALDLDGSGRHAIDTGLGFLDHMLAQVALHGLFDLEIQAQGDLHIDPHHTMEDVALTLGAAFLQALGERKGIVRMGSALVPMDESLAQVVVDLSGRPYAVIQVDWNAPLLGAIPTSLFAHFLESFASQARCNLHVRVLAGRDDHHMAEAIFKALGRALDAAARVDPRRGGQVPSTKGVL